jgi:hypothetical protein
MKLAKYQLNMSIQRKKDESLRKTGGATGMSMSSSAKVKPVSMRGTTDKVISTTRKLMEAPQRLLQEEDINELLELDLCRKCR